MSAVIAAERFIYEALTGDAALMSMVTGVFRDTAPEDAEYPLVRFALYGDGQTHRNDSGRMLWSRLDFVVTAVGEGESRTALDAIADRIKQVLHRSSGGQVLSALQVAPVAYEDRDGERVYQYLGAVYEITVRED